MQVERPIGEKTRGEIERKLEGMGDYVKMSYLQRALKSKLDYDTRKFVLLRLSGIYEDRKMHLDAARLIRSAAEINTTFRDKIKDFMKSVELYIKAGNFDEADIVFSQSLALANISEKNEMKTSFKNYYLTQAKIAVKSDKRNHARKIYEKALTLELETGERSEIKKQLLILYEKLGDVRSYLNLKNSM